MFRKPRPDAQRLALLLVLAAVPGAALAEPPAGFVEHVEALRQDSGAPGIAIAIVEHGQTTLAQGWGVRQMGESAKVDADTIFATGSTGKAFTVAAIATLVDQGKLGWDDKVIDHIPWFQMHDPWVTREITVRDLMVHRSGLGLGAGDLMFVPRTSLTRKETVERLRYIAPATSFRSAYAYDNVLYVVLGQLIEEVTGKTWEEYMDSEVLDRGGMTVSTSTYDARYATANRALPHARVGGALRGDGPNSVLDERDELGRNAMPAGGLAMSANDLAQWLRIQLGHGVLPGGGRLFSEGAAREMWTPVTPMPITEWPGDLAPATPKYSAYALGWDVEEYRGARMIWHSGGVFGAITVVVLLPDQDVGFAIAINSEEAALRRGLMYELIDHYLGLPDNDWYRKWDTFVDARLEGGKAALAQMQDTPADVGPSLPLATYAGTYRDPWYGDVVVSERDGGLWIDFTSTPRMAGRLVHYQYDTFRTELTDTKLENALVTFQLDAHGKVERAKMVAASPLADFSYDYQDLDLRPVGDTQVKTLFAAASLAALAACSQQAEAPADDPLAVHRGLLVLDTHLDTAINFDRPGWSFGARHTPANDLVQLDLPRMADGNLDGGFFSIYTAQGPLTAQGYADALAFARKRSDSIDRVISENAAAISPALTAADAERLAADGKLIAFKSIENSYPLGEDVTRLQEFYDRGVRLAGPVHSVTNQFADSSGDDGKWGGLSPLGRQWVAEMNRLGIVIDGSHASDATLDKLLELSKAPILLSHTSPRSAFEHPRNLDDGRIKKLADKGGAICMSTIYLTPMNLSDARAKLFDQYEHIAELDPKGQAELVRQWRELDRTEQMWSTTFEQYMAALLHVIEVAGVDHVCFGADWDGGGGIAGMEDITALPTVTRRLLAAGYSRADVGKMTGGNVLRILGEAQGAAGR